jgi:hypothetical protein
MREAQKPFMGIIQSGFMMWMSGNMISIWSMMMTSMGIINPINAALGVNALRSMSRFGFTVVSNALN